MFCLITGQGSAGKPTNWEKCDAVARLITACPLQSETKESYYSVVCPQVLFDRDYKKETKRNQFACPENLVIPC